MLFRLPKQTLFCTVNEKTPYTSKAYLLVLRVTISLVSKFKHLYYESPRTHEIPFSSSKLSQIHRNLGHTPPEFVYSASCLMYSIEIGASDLKT